MIQILIWIDLETQLQTRSHLVRSGKKIRAEMLFNYLDLGGTAAASQRTKRKHPTGQYRCQLSQGLGKVAPETRQTREFDLAASLAAE